MWGCAETIGPLLHFNKTTLNHHNNLWRAPVCTQFAPSALSAEMTLAAPSAGMATGCSGHKGGHADPLPGRISAGEPHQNENRKGQN